MTDTLNDTRDQVRARNQKYYAANKEAILEKQRLKYIDNRDVIVARNKASILKRKDTPITDPVVLERRRIMLNAKCARYVAKNHDKMKQYQREKQKEYYHRRKAAAAAAAQGV